MLAMNLMPRFLCPIGLMEYEVTVDARRKVMRSYQTSELQRPRESGTVELRSDFSNVRKTRDAFGAAQLTGNLFGNPFLQETNATR